MANKLEKWSAKYQCLTPEELHEFVVYYDSSRDVLMGLCDKCGYEIELSTRYIDEVFEHGCK